MHTRSAPAGGKGWRGPLCSSLGETCTSLDSARQRQPQATGLSQTLLYTQRSSWGPITTGGLELADWKCFRTPPPPRLPVSSSTAARPDRPRSSLYHCGNVWVPAWWKQWVWGSCQGVMLSVLRVFARSCCLRCASFTSSLYGSSFSSSISCLNAITREFADHPPCLTP